MQNFLGHDGFIWWVGEVEDVNDPDVLGRCKVRIFGYHDDTALIPKADLPWATAIHSPNTPNMYSPLAVGDWVFGFFLDSLNAQEPAIVGFIPTIKNPRTFKRVATLGNIDIRTCLELGNNYVEVIKDGYIEIYQKKGGKLTFDEIGNVKLNVPEGNIYLTTNNDISSSSDKNTTFRTKEKFRVNSNTNIELNAQEDFKVFAKDNLSIDIDGGSKITGTGNTLIIETTDFSIQANTILLEATDFGIQANAILLEGGDSITMMGGNIDLQSKTDIGLTTANNNVSVDILVAMIQRAWSEANSAHAAANSAQTTANTAIDRLNSPTIDANTGCIISI